MEVLAEGREWFAYIFLMAVAFFIFLGTATAIISGIRGCKDDLKANIIGVILCGIGCIGAVVMLVHLFYAAEEFDYLKVKITDFNIVYEQGYEISDQEGDIYKIVKKVGE